MLAKNPEAKKPLRIPRRRLKDNIKIDFKGIGCVDWIILVLNRFQWQAVVNTAMKRRIT
jgi:hypothetical protein